MRTIGTLALGIALGLACRFDPGKLELVDGSDGRDGTAADEEPDAAMADAVHDFADCGGVACPSCCDPPEGEPYCADTCSGGWLYLCDGPEDCPGAQCCWDRTNGGTFCGACEETDEICHDVSTCDLSGDSECTSHGLVLECGRD